MKKLICLLIFVFCLSSAFNVTFAQKESFSGKRNVSLTADISDIDNFIGGGRSELDVVLRQSIPEFADMKIHSQGRDLNIDICFEFSSYEDYIQKVDQLINGSSVVVYNDDDGVFLMENFRVSAFLNFTEPALTLSDNTFEKRLEEIFSVTENKITINGKTYSSDTDKMNVRPDDSEENAKFKKISITVEENENNFSGSIFAEADTSVYDFDLITKNFEKCGVTEIHEAYGNVKGITVILEAETQHELTEKIMKCLNVSFSVQEKEFYVDDKTVGVNRTEIIDIQSVMEENATFTYGYTYPSYFDNIVVDGESSQLTDTVIGNVNNGSVISYYYERGLKFNRIEVNTDFSNKFGKINKNITFVLPINMATEYNDTIKKQLSDRMIKGTVFEIKDEGFNRYYKLSYSSWFSKDVSEFASKILATRQKMKISDSWLPYGKSKIEETAKVGEVIDNMIDPGQFVASYTFSGSSKIYPHGNKKEWIINGNKAEITVLNDKVSLYYRKFSILKIIVLVVCLIVLIVAIILITGRIKKIKSRIKGKGKTPVPEKTPEDKTEIINV